MGVDLLGFAQMPCQDVGNARVETKRRRPVRRQSRTVVDTGVGKRTNQVIRYDKEIDQRAIAIASAGASGGIRRNNGRLDLAGKAEGVELLWSIIKVSTNDERPLPCSASFTNLLQ